jgi:hypothetical protein
MQKAPFIFSPSVKTGSPFFMLYDDLQLAILSSSFAQCFQRAKFPNDALFTLTYSLA